MAETLSMAGLRCTIRFYMGRIGRELGVDARVCASQGLGGFERNVELQKTD